MSLFYSEDSSSEYNYNQIDFIYKKLKDKELTEYEKKLLKEFDKIWNDYEKTKANKESLYGIFSLLSNKNSKQHILAMNTDQSSINPFQGIFSESVSLKDLIKAVVKFARVKPKIKSKLKTVKKGIFDTVFKAFENNSFSIKLDNSHYKLILKRKKYLSSINDNKCNNVKTKTISYSSKGKQYHNLSLYQSILFAVESGSYKQNPFKIIVNPTHFRYPVYSFKQDFNMMMVLDTSNSISWITGIIDKVISLITNSVKNCNDKLGLITFSNEKANVIHYPTKNVRQIAGSVNKSKPSGLTPLSDGLKMAVTVLSQNRYNLPGMANAIILISDCYPEPLTYKYKDLFDEPICKEFIFACEKIAEKKIKLLIIIPILNEAKIKTDRIGYRLAKLGVEKANGEIVNLKGNVSFDFLNRMNTYHLDKHFEAEIQQQISNLRTGL